MAFRSAAFTSGNGNITLPAGLTAGDAILIGCTTDTTGVNWNGSALGGGIVKLDGPIDITLDAQAVALYGGVYTSGNISLTASGGGDPAYFAVCFSGRSSNPFTLQQTPANSGVNTNLDLTGITAATGDDIAAFSMLDIPNATPITQTPPGSYGEQLDTGVGFSYASVATRDNVSSGATGTLTFVASGGTGYAGWVVRIAAAPLAPIITTDPQSQTKYIGDMATFTVSATTSGGTLHYQWKKNGGNVGTDSNSYTTGTLDFSNDSEIYTVDVSDNNGTTTSNNAELTIVFSSYVNWFSA